MTVLYLLSHYSTDREGGVHDKLIGVYSAEEKARAAIERLRDQPGFVDHPQGFQISARTVDETVWTDFATARRGDDAASPSEPPPVEQAPPR